MFSDPIRFVYFLVALITGLTVHECAHAFVADRLGDDTGRKLGRVTLNPIAHLDPTGALMILMSSIFGVGFGWGKPVPVNPWNLRIGPKTGMAVVAAAGPVSNLLLAGVLALAVQQGADLPGWAVRLVLYAILVNVSLAVFNLLPLPPLDGFSVLLGVLPNAAARPIARLQQFGPGLLLLLVFFGGNLLGQYLNFFSSPILRAFGLA